MKALFYLLTLFLLTSCSSNEPASEDVFNKVKERKLASKDTSIMNALKTTIPIKQKPIKARVSEKINLSEWDQFKVATETKIHANELKIIALKAQSNTDAKMIRKINMLEKKNSYLRIRMDHYKEELKVIWENFQTDMNHDVNGIEIELKDIHSTHLK